MPADSRPWLTVPRPAEPRSPELLLKYFGIPPDPEDQLEANINEKRRLWSRRANSGNPEGRVKALEVLEVLKESAARLRARERETRHRPQASDSSGRKRTALDARLAAEEQRLLARLQDRSPTGWPKRRKARAEVEERASKLQAQVKEDEVALFALERQRDWAEHDLENQAASHTRAKEAAGRRLRAAQHRIQENLRGHRVEITKRRHALERHDPEQRQLETQQHDHVTRWLKRWRIARAAALGLTQEKGRALSRHGFRTARDIDPDRTLASPQVLSHVDRGRSYIPDIGSAEIRALVAWRSRLEKVARHHETHPRTLTQQERATVQREHARALAQLDDEARQAEQAAARRLDDAVRVSTAAMKPEELKLRAAREKASLWRLTFAREAPRRQAALHDAKSELEMVNRLLSYTRIST